MNPSHPKTIIWQIILLTRWTSNLEISYFIKNNLPVEGWGRGIKRIKLSRNSLHWGARYRNLETSFADCVECLQLGSNK